MTTHKLDGLNHMLQLWEQANAFADYIFNFNLKNTIDHLAVSDFKVSPGSELSKDYKNIVRSIPNFKLLRSDLEKRRLFDPMTYMPRIPKELRGKIDSVVNILMKGGREYLGLYPWFLSHWLINKKLCELHNISKIELVNPGKENYLSALPYDDFLLHIPEELHSVVVKTGSDNTKIHKLVSTNLLFLHKDNDLLYIYGIDSNVEKAYEEFGVYNESMKRFFEKLNHNKAAILDNDAPSYMISIFVVDTLRGQLLEVDKDFQFIQSSWEPKDASGVARDLLSGRTTLSHTIYFINGLCKLLATNSKAEHEYLMTADLGNFEPKELEQQDVKKKDKLPVIEERLEWFEVPTGQTIYLTIEKKKSSRDVSLKAKIGTEKDWHERRRHPRRYRDENGVITKTIWIEKTEIHPEKRPVDRQPFGSTSKIK